MADTPPTVPPTGPSGPPAAAGPTRRERRAADRSRTRRRRIALLMGAVLVLGVGAALAYLLNRDDGNDASTPRASVPTSTSLGVSTSTTGGLFTTTTSPGGSTTTLAAPDPDDPQAFAETLFQAWAGGDRSQAAPVATASAIDKLFRTPSSEASAYTFRSCEVAEGTLFCSWTRAGGQLVMLVNDGTGGTTVAVFDVQIGAG